MLARALRRKNRKRLKSCFRFFLWNEIFADAYFSVQNVTFSPARIIFVVRTAHILPHIEQV